MNEEADWWQRVAMIGGWPAWDIMKDGTDKNPPKSKYKNRYKKTTGKYKKRTYKKR